MTVNIKRIISVLVASCFLLTSVSGQAAASVTGNLRATQQFKQIFTDFALPYSYGKITDAHFASTDRVIINIQDLHCHPKVQKNISNIIDLFDKKYGVKNVYLEGAYGDVDTSWISNAVDSTAKMQLVEKMVNTGRLTGAEYFSAVSGKTGIIKGLEKKEPYLENLKRFGQILENKDKINLIMESVRRSDNELKIKYFDKRQLKIEELAKHYEQGKITAEKYYALLTKHIDRLGIDIYRYENTLNYIMLLSMQKDLKYTEITKQLQTLIFVLKETIPYGAYKMLADSTGNFSQIDKLYLYLIKLTRQYNLDMSVNYPELDNYFRYVELSQKINPIVLLEENQKLTEEINSRFSNSKSQSEVVFLVNFERYLNDYLTSKMTASDYAYYKANIKRYKKLWAKYVDNKVLALLEEYIACSDTFYEVNTARNGYFTENIFNGVSVSSITASVQTNNEILNIIENMPQAKRVDVIITGGFHTETVSGILKDHNVSYLVITPNVTDGLKTAEETYYKIAKEQSKISFQALANLIASLSPVEQKRVLIAADPSLESKLGFIADGQDTVLSRDQIKQLAETVKMSEVLLSDDKGDIKQQIIQNIKDRLESSDPELAKETDEELIKYVDMDKLKAAFENTEQLKKLIGYASKIKTAAKDSVIGQSLSAIEDISSKITLAIEMLQGINLLSKEFSKSKIPGNTTKVKRENIINVISKIFPEYQKFFTDEDIDYLITYSIDFFNGFPDEKVFEKNTEELILSILDPDSLAIAIRPFRPAYLPRINLPDALRKQWFKEIAEECAKYQKDYLNKMRPDIRNKFFAAKLLRGENLTNITQYLHGLKKSGLLSNVEKVFLGTISLDSDIGKQLVVEEVVDYSSSRIANEGNIVLRVTLKNLSGNTITFFIKGLDKDYKIPNRKNAKYHFYENTFYWVAGILGLHSIYIDFYSTPDDRYTQGYSIMQVIPGEDTSRLFDMQKNDSSHFKIKDKYKNQKDNLIASFAVFAALTDLLGRGDSKIIKTHHPMFSANYMFDVLGNGEIKIYPIDATLLFNPDNSHVIKTMREFGDLELGIILAFYEDKNGLDEMLEIYRKEYLETWKKIKDNAKQMKEYILSVYGEDSWEYPIFLSAIDKDPELLFEQQKQALLEYISANAGQDFGSISEGKPNGEELKDSETAQTTKPALQEQSTGESSVFQPQHKKNSLMRNITKKILPFILAITILFTGFLNIGRYGRQPSATAETQTVAVSETVAPAVMDSQLYENNRFLFNYLRNNQSLFAPSDIAFLNASVELSNGSEAKGLVKQIYKTLGIGAETGSAPEILFLTGSNAPLYSACACSDINVIIIPVGADLKLPSAGEMAAKVAHENTHIKNHQKVISGEMSQLEDETMATEAGIVADETYEKNLVIKSMFNGTVSVNDITAMPLFGFYSILENQEAVVKKFIEITGDKNIMFNDIYYSGVFFGSQNKAELPAEVKLDSLGENEVAIRLYYGNTSIMYVVKVDGSGYSLSKIEVFSDNLSVQADKVQISEKISLYYSPNPVFGAEDVINSFDILSVSEALLKSKDINLETLQFISFYFPYEREDDGDSDIIRFIVRDEKGIFYGIDLKKDVGIIKITNNATGEEVWKAKEGLSKDIIAPESSQQSGQRTGTLGASVTIESSRPEKSAYSKIYKLSVNKLKAFVQNENNGISERFLAFLILKNKGISIQIPEEMLAAGKQYLRDIESGKITIITAEEIKNNEYKTADDRLKSALAAVYYIMLNSYINDFNIEQTVLDEIWKDIYEKAKVAFSNSGGADSSLSFQPDSLTSDIMAHELLHNITDVYLGAEKNLTSSAFAEFSSDIAKIVLCQQLGIDIPSDLKDRYKEYAAYIKAGAVPLEEHYLARGIIGLIMEVSADAGRNVNWNNMMSAVSQCLQNADFVNLINSNNFNKVFASVLEKYSEIETGRTVEGVEASSEQTSELYDNIVKLLTPQLTMTWLSKLLDFLKITDFEKRQQWINAIENPIIILGLFSPIVKRWFIKQHKGQSPEVVQQGINEILKQAGLIAADCVPTMGLIKMLTNKTARKSLSKAHAFWNIINGSANVVSVEDVLNKLAPAFYEGYEFSDQFKEKIRKLILMETLFDGDTKDSFIDRIIARLLHDLLSDYNGKSEDYTLSDFNSLKIPESLLKITDKWENAFKVPEISLKEETGYKSIAAKIKLASVVKEAIDGLGEKKVGQYTRDKREYEVTNIEAGSFKQKSIHIAIQKPGFADMNVIVNDDGSVDVQFPTKFNNEQAIKLGKGISSRKDIEKYVRCFYDDESVVNYYVYEAEEIIIDLLTEKIKDTSSFNKSDETLEDWSSFDLNKNSILKTFFTDSINKTKNITTTIKDFLLSLFIPNDILKELGIKSRDLLMPNELLQFDDKIKSKKREIETNIDAFLKDSKIKKAMEMAAVGLGIPNIIDRDFLLKVFDSEIMNKAVKDYVNGDKNREKEAKDFSRLYGYMVFEKEFFANPSNAGKIPSSDSEIEIAEGQSISLAEWLHICDGHSPFMNGNDIKHPDRYLTVEEALHDAIRWEDLSNIMTIKKDPDIIIYGKQDGFGQDSIVYVKNVLGKVYVYVENIGVSGSTGRVKTFFVISESKYKANPISHIIQQITGNEKAKEVDAEFLKQLTVLVKNNAGGQQILRGGDIKRDDNKDAGYKFSKVTAAASSDELGISEVVFEKDEQFDYYFADSECMRYDRKSFKWEVMPIKKILESLSEKSPVKIEILKYFKNKIKTESKRFLSRLQLEDIILPAGKDGIFGFKYGQKYKFFDMEGNLVGEIRERELQIVNEGIAGFIYKNGAFIVRLKDGNLQLEYRPVVQSDLHKYIYNGGLTDQTGEIIEITQNIKNNMLYKFGDISNLAPKQLYKIEHKQLFKFEGEWKVCKGKDGKNIILDQEGLFVILSVFNSGIEESKLTDMIVLQINQIKSNARIYTIADSDDEKNIVMLDNDRVFYANKWYQIPNLQSYKDIRFRMIDKKIVVMYCDGMEKGIFCIGHFYQDAKILNRQYKYVFNKGVLNIENLHGELVASCKNGEVAFAADYDSSVFGKRIIINPAFKAAFSVLAAPFRERKEIDRIYKGEIETVDFLMKHKGYREGGNETRQLYESRLSKLLKAIGKFAGFPLLMRIANVAVHAALNIQALITGSVLLTVTDDDYSQYLNKLNLDKESFEYVYRLVKYSPEAGNVSDLIKSDKIAEAKKIIYGLLEAEAVKTETEMKSFYDKIYSGEVLEYEIYDRIFKLRLMQIQMIMDKYFSEFAVDNLPVLYDEKEIIAKSGFVDKDQSISILYETKNEILCIETDCMGLAKLVSKNKDVMDTSIHQILGMKDVDLGIEIETVRQNGKWAIVVKKGGRYVPGTKITIIDDNSLPKYTAPLMDETVSDLKLNHKKELDALNINIDDRRAYEIIALDDVLTPEGKVDITKLPDVRNIPLLIYPAGYGLENDSLSDKDRYNLFFKNLSIFVDLGDVLFEKLLGRQLKFIEETESFFIREALKNALIHGNGGDVNKPIYVICGYDEITGEYYVNFYNQNDEKTSEKILSISAAARLSGSHLGALSLEEGVKFQKDLYSGSGVNGSGMFFTYLTNSKSYGSKMKPLIKEKNGEVVNNEKTQVVKKYLALVEQKVSGKYGRSPEISKLIIDMIEEDPTFVLTDFNDFVGEVNDKLEKAEDKLIGRIDGKLGNIIDIIPDETLAAMDAAVIRHKYKGYTLEQVKNISDLEIQKMADEILAQLQPIADRITAGDSQKTDIMPSEMIKDVINPVTVITKTAVLIVSAENINEELQKNGVSTDIKTNLIVTDNIEQAQNLRGQGFNAVNMRIASSKEMKGRKGLIIGESEGVQIRAYLDNVKGEIVFYSNDSGFDMGKVRTEDLKNMLKSVLAEGINNKAFKGLKQIIVVENDTALETVISAMKNAVTDGLTKPPVSINLDFSGRKDVSSKNIEKITNGETNNGLDSSTIIFSAEQISVMSETDIRTLQAKGYEVLVIVSKISQAEDIISRLHINGAVLKTDGNITQTELIKIKQISDSNVRGSEIIKTQMYVEGISDEVLNSFGDIYEKYSILPIVAAGSLYPQTGQKCSVRINEKDGNTAGLFERSNVLSVIADKISTVKKSAGILADIISDILKPVTPKQKFITELRNVQSSKYDFTAVNIKESLKNKNGVLFKLIAGREWFDGEDEKANEEKLKGAINALLSENILSGFAKTRVEKFMKEGRYYEALGCIRGCVEKTVESMILSKLKAGGIDIMRDKLGKYAGGLLRNALIITGIRLLAEGKDIEPILEDAFIDSDMTAQQYFDSVIVRLNGQIKDIVKANEYTVNVLGDEKSTDEAIADFKDFNLLMQDQIREKSTVKAAGISSSAAVRSILGAA